ncbi:MAG TPA: glycosyltransferase family 4 protein [Longimicrobiaceae bacterium]|nr:glycosyltransferase family 4 protein [Longimicrobiaceae bacterium]
MRFCMVTTFYPPYNYGGDGIGVQRLARALVRRGHEVTVIHDVDAFNALRPGPEPALPADSDGVEVVRLRSRLGVLSPILTHQTGRPVVHGARIRQLLESGRFDVINFHNISLVGGPGILSAGSALKVYTAHEHWLICPTHVLWRHGREPCSGRECTLCVLRRPRPLQYWRYSDFLERQLDQVDLFLAVSEFSRRKHREFGFEHPMEVLPQFLPPLGADYPATEAPPPHERPYFLFVGRLERIKGLEDVIPVFRRYEDADLLVVGDGSDAAVLKRLAAEVPRVRFLGSLSTEELPRYYRHALGLIVPSIGFETFGIILIEAFRQGVPVIARRLGPFPEIVEQAGGGMLFSTPAELLTAMHRLQSEPVLRQQLSDAGERAFRQHWSEEVVVPRYLELIEQAAKRKRQPRTVTPLDAGAPV